MVCSCSCYLTSPLEVKAHFGSTATGAEMGGKDGCRGATNSSASDPLTGVCMISHILNTWQLPLSTAASSRIRKNFQLDPSIGAISPAKNLLARSQNFFIELLRGHQQSLPQTLQRCRKRSSSPSFDWDVPVPRRAPVQQCKASIPSSDGGEFMPSEPWFSRAALSGASRHLSGTHPRFERNKWRKLGEPLLTVWRALECGIVRPEMPSCFFNEVLQFCTPVDRCNDVENLGLYVEACHVCLDRDGSDSFQLYQVFVIFSPFISSSPVGYEGFGNFAWRFAISSSRHLPGSPLARCTRQPTGAGESFEWLDILSTRHSCGVFAVPYRAIPSHVNMHPWGCYRLIWRNGRISKTGVMAWSIQSNMIMHEH